jgi:hypothetical protein
MLVLSSFFYHWRRVLTIRFVGPISRTCDEIFHIEFFYNFFVEKNFLLLIRIYLVTLNIMEFKVFLMCLENTFKLSIDEYSLFFFSEVRVDFKSKLMKKKIIRLFLVYMTHCYIVCFRFINCYIIKNYRYE